MSLHAVREILAYLFLALFAGNWAAFITGHGSLSDALEVASDAVYGGLVTCLVLARDWTDAGIGVAVLVLIFWWDNRRKGRKGARKSLGAKALARRDALVRRVRELRPRPARVPVPVRR